MKKLYRATLSVFCLVTAKIGTYAIAGFGFKVNICFILSFLRYIISSNLILQKPDRYFQMIIALHMNLDFHQSQRVPQLKLCTLKQCSELRSVSCYQQSPRTQDEIKLIPKNNKSPAFEHSVKYSSWQLYTRLPPG